MAAVACRTISGHIKCKISRRIDYSGMQGVYVLCKRRYARLSCARERLGKMAFCAQDWEIMINDA